MQKYVGFLGALFFFYSAPLLAGEDYYKQTSGCEVIQGEHTLAARPGIFPTTPFWAQEMIGSDLAIERMQSLKTRMNIAPVSGGMIDSLSAPKVAKASADIFLDGVKLNNTWANRTHGDQVIDLIDSPTFGSTQDLTWKFLGQIVDPSLQSKSFTELISAKVKLVNASFGFRNQPDLIKSAEAFTSQGGILVKASGNYFPSPPEEATENSIRIGSLAPNGFVSVFSQQNVDALVPSDYWVLNDPHSTFGGTSGATPLATGSIANVLALLPHLTPADIQFLLSKTSVKGITQYASDRDGAGMLNAYRIVRVAECLKDKGVATGLKNASEFASCNGFHAESAALVSQANLLLTDKNSCAGERSALHLLRQAFLLSPSDALAQRLASVYLKHGFPVHAQFFQSFAQEQALQNEFFAEALKTQTFDHRTRAMNLYYFNVDLPGAQAFGLAGRAGPKSKIWPVAFSQLSKNALDASADVRATAAEQALLMGPDALPILEKLLSDPKSSVRKEAASVIAHMATYWNNYTCSPLNNETWIVEANEYVKAHSLEKAVVKNGDGSFKSLVPLPAQCSSASPKIASASASDDLSHQVANVNQQLNALNSNSITNQVNGQSGNPKTASQERSLKLDLPTASAEDKKVEATAAK